MTRNVIEISCRFLAILASGASCFVNCACVSGQLDSAMQQAARIKYIDDEGGDYWQSPEETIARGTGDCEDQAIYLHHLLGLKGLQSEVVFGIENLKHVESGHVWVEYPADDDIYILDPTRRMMRLRSKLPRHQYYPALDQKLIQRKVEAYLKRSGQSGLNAHYEARIRAGRGR
ncbi:MAG: transglutaminase-like domain-containing protein [Phycisphaerae bacterium]|nr:transglutaminase-like domain-containing protein [Phycisphaerae bacterium]